MAIRIAAAAFLSAVLMFLWGFVYWGPVLNMTGRLMAPLPADKELDILAPMRSANLPDGMYVRPGPLMPHSDEKATAQWEAKVKEGPILHMAYHAGGISPMDPTTLAKGFAHSFVIALLAGILLAMVAHSLPTYGGRVAVLLLVTVIAAAWTNVGNVIWWFYTPRYAAGQMAYEIVAGMLMALVTAAIIRPRTPVVVSATP
jgi:hypothetical protein